MTAGDERLAALAAVVLLDEQLDALLCRIEDGAAAARQHHPVFKRQERLFQREAALLQPQHHLAQPIEHLIEAELLPRLLLVAGLAEGRSARLAR